MTRLIHSRIKLDHVIAACIVLSKHTYPINLKYCSTRLAIGKGTGKEAFTSRLRSKILRQSTEARPSQGFKAESHSRNKVVKGRCPNGYFQERNFDYQHSNICCFVQTLMRAQLPQLRGIESSSRSGTCRLFRTRMRPVRCNPCRHTAGISWKCRWWSRQQSQLQSKQRC